MNLEVILKLLLLIALNGVKGGVILKALFPERKIEIPVALGTGFVVSLVLGLVLTVLRLFHLYFVVEVGVMAVVFFVMLLVKPLRKEDFLLDSSHAWMLVLAVAAMCVWFPAVNFLPMIGDAGEYVNSANQLAREGFSASEFLPVTRVAFGIFSQYLGWKHMASGALVFNLLSLALLFNFANKISRAKPYAWACAFVFFFSPLSFFMAKMPYSEVILLFLNLMLLNLSMSLLSENFKFRWVHITLWGVVLMLALLTRVTSILWTVSAILCLVYTFFQKSGKQFERFYPIAITGLSALTLLGLWGAIFSRRVVYGVYFGIPYRGIEPWIFIVALLALVAGVVLSGFVKTKKNWFDKIFVFRKAVLFLSAALVISGFVIFVVTKGHLVRKFGLFLESVEGMSLVGVFRDVISRFSLTHVLWMFFSPAFVVLVPVALVALWASLRKWLCEAFARPGLLLAVVWSVLALVFLSLPSFALREHAVYLYWARYLYPELFLVLVMLVGILIARLFLDGRVVLRGLALALVLFMLVNFASWYRENRDFRLFNNFDKVVEEIHDTVETRVDLDSIVVIDTDPEARFFYINMDRTLTSPLMYTAGLNVHRDPRLIANPFLPQPRLRTATVNYYLNQGKTVFLVVISDSSDYDGASGKFSGIHEMVQMNQFEYTIDYKRFNFRDIINTPVEKYDFKIKIFRISAK